jgi:hypothetical protein
MLSEQKVFYSTIMKNELQIYKQPVKQWLKYNVTLYNFSLMIILILFYTIVKKSHDIITNI